IVIRQVINYVQASVAIGHISQAVVNGGSVGDAGGRKTGDKYLGVGRIAEVIKRDIIGSIQRRARIIRGNRIARACRQELFPAKLRGVSRVQQHGESRVDKAKRVDSFIVRGVGVRTANKQAAVPKGRARDR